MGKKTYWVKEKPASDLELKIKAALLVGTCTFALLWGATEVMLNEYRDDSVRDGIYFVIVFFHRYSIWVAVACFIALLVWAIIEEIQENKYPKTPKYLS